MNKGVGGSDFYIHCPKFMTSQNSWGGRWVSSTWDKFLNSTVFLKTSLFKCVFDINLLLQDSTQHLHFWFFVHFIQWLNQFFTARKSIATILAYEAPTDKLISASAGPCYIKADPKYNKASYKFKGIFGCFTNLRPFHQKNHAIQLVVWGLPLYFGWAYTEYISLFIVRLNFEDQHW